MHGNLISYVVIFLTVSLCSCARSHRSEIDESRRVAHLSLDDVEVFGDLIRNQQEYDSLFQHPLMAFLQELHHEHGLRITLYTFEYFRDGDSYTCIEDMPLKYKDDFKKASDWLRIGFHSKRADIDSLVSVADFRESYDNVNSAISQFADSTMIASTLRFHYFFAPDSLLNSLSGVRNLLCADDDNRLSYNLTVAEAKALGNGGNIVKNEIIYRKTDLRADDNYQLYIDLKRLESIDTLVVFAHEWKLWHNAEKFNTRRASGKITLRSSECVNKLIFKEIIKWLHEEGYEFSFLE